MGRGQYLFRFALLGLLVSACGFPVGDATSNTAKVKNSAALADQWLGAALENATTNDQVGRLGAVRSVVETRQMIVDAKHDGGPCNDNTSTSFTLAYVKSPITQSPIHLCAEALNYDNDIVAQVLIHESGHGAGNSNECTTTRQELEFMVLAGERPFKNAYVGSDDCASYHLGQGIDFVTLEDGAVGYVPGVETWTTTGAPVDALYMRVPRAPASFDGFSALGDVMRMLKLAFFVK